MPKLLNRQRQIPNGLRFYQPELRWTSPRQASFDQIVQGLMRARLANPGLAAKHKWATTYDGVADDVDRFNAAICAQAGWTDYITNQQAGSVPKSTPRGPLNLQSLKDAAVAAKELVRGAKTLIEFIDSGEKPEPTQVAEARAAVCEVCPKNTAGDLTQWFTVPAAELIRRQIEKAQQLNLKTSRDGKLHLCSACHCPLKLKVHIPLDWIKKRLSPEQMARLREAPACWIVANAPAPTP